MRQIALALIAAILILPAVANGTQLGFQFASYLVAF